MPRAQVNEAALNRLRKGKEEMNARNAALEDLDGKMFPKSVPDYTKLAVNVLPNKTPNNSQVISPNMKLKLNALQQQVNKVKAVQNKYNDIQRGLGRKKTRRVKQRKSKKTRRH